MIILGIDPGLATTGYGVIKKKGNSFKLIDYDTITTSADETDVDRYKEGTLLLYFGALLWRCSLSNRAFQCRK